MTTMPMPERVPDPYGEGEPSFEAFRAMWRDGATLDALYGDGPFALRRPVGPYKPNRQGDVAKVQSLLHDTGYLDANETDGPTGIYSRMLLDEPVRRFQQDNDLEVDGILNPDGETIGALETLLGPHTGRDPFDISDEAPPPSVARPGGVQVVNESGALGAGGLLGLGLFSAATLEMRRKLREMDRSRGSALSSDGPSPYPAEPPFAPGELQPPGYPAKPPFDPNEANKDRTPPKPMVVKGTTFPAIAESKPQIMIFPDLSKELEQIQIAEIRHERPETKDLNDLAADLWIEQHPGWKKIGGGRNKAGKEESERRTGGPGIAWKKDGRPGDGRHGSIYDDVTVESPDGKIVHIQTVDVDKNGKPTERELDTALRLFKATQENVVLIGKTWQMEKK